MTNETPQAQESIAAGEAVKKCTCVLEKYCDCYLNEEPPMKPDTKPTEPFALVKRLGLEVVDSPPEAPRVYASDLEALLRDNFIASYDSRFDKIDLELKPAICEHEAEYAGSMILTSLPPKRVDEFKCRKCGVKLKAKWEPVND